MIRRAVGTVQRVVGSTQQLEGREFEQSAVFPDFRNLQSRLNQEFDDEPAFIVELAKEEKRNVRSL
jgi:hypothetical protein